MHWDWDNPHEKHGPGLVGNTGQFSSSSDASCLDMERKTYGGQQGYLLKVFASKDIISSAQPLDGVVRNIVFENTVSKTSIDTSC